MSAAPLPATSPQPARRGLFAEARRDAPAGLVVFLVALPLCLGIAQASGAPLFAGLIAGIVGGLVVGSLSGSALSVSGPAAGLAVIVAGGISDLGFPAFLTALVLAGLLQVVLGVLRLGTIAHFFPNAVIKGMLASIGVLIILKQLPHAVGYDADFVGDESFLEPSGDNTFSALFDAAQAVSPAVILITLACIGAYLLWPRLQRGPLVFVPPAFVAVALGAALTAAIRAAWPAGALSAEHLVSLPVFESAGELGRAIVTPDVTRLFDASVWGMALVLAIVASIETLLCLEASDRLDAHRRISPPNRELIAQGIGNAVSGLIGGIPVTSVIVRTSANAQAGAQTRLATIVHGLHLLVGLLFFAPLLNSIPLAALAVVLLFVGFKLTSPSLWRAMWRAGWGQFTPFAITVVAVVFSDLLTGTLIGLVVGVLFAIRQQQRGAVVQVSDGGRTLIRFTRDLTFLNKARLKKLLAEVPQGEHVIVDQSLIDYVDDDIEEILLDFREGSAKRGIRVELQLSPRVRERYALLQATHAAIDAQTRGGKQSPESQNTPPSDATTAAGVGAPGGADRVAPTENQR